MMRVGVACLVLLQVGVEIAEAGALAGFGVVARQGVVEGGAALRPETLSHHDLDEPSQAADALEKLLGVALVDDEGVHALAGDAGGQHAPTRGAGHVRVLALRVDDVGRDAARNAAQHAQLGGEALAAARPCEDGGVGIHVRPVPGVVDHGGAGPHVDAVEGAAAGVHVRRREGEEAGQGRGVEAAPVGDGVQGQGQRRKQALALAEGQGVQLAEGRAEVGLRPLGHLLERGLVPAVKGHGEGCVEEPLPASLHLVAQAGHVLQGDLRLGRHGAARLKERDWADSKRTFCHSRVLAACSAGIGPTWTDRSIGAPAAISPWRKPGARERGHLPRWRERVICAPTRMSRRPISTSTGCSSSNSVGEPPRAAETTSILSCRPRSGWTDSPALERRPRKSSMRANSHTA